LKKHRLARATAFLALAIIASAACADKARLTTHKEMMSRLASLEVVDAVWGYGRLKVASIGRSVNGKDIPLVTVSDPNVPVESTKRLFVICRQHGDEPASTEAMLNLIEDLVLLADEGTADLLSKVSFLVVPMMNPDGADRCVRRNANGADLNRDWLGLQQPETRYVCAAIDAAAPDVIIDAHELSPGNRRSDFVATAGPAYGVSPEVALESGRMQRLVIGMLRTHDMEVRSYQVEDQHPARLAHRYFPVYGNTTTFLFETRQAGLRQYQLQYRMKLHIVGTMTVAKYLAGHEEELARRIAAYDAHRRWVQLASRSKKSAAKRKQ